MSTGTPCDPVTTCVTCEPGTSDANCVRYKLSPHPWDRRDEMICGHGGNYLFTISPHGKQFLVTPALNDVTILKVVWDGFLHSMSDSQEVPFPAEASEAVAAYVMWKLSRNVDKNIPLSKEYEADYIKLRLSLFRDFNDSQWVDGKDEEYGDNNLTAPTNLAEFGAQNVPFLANITTIQGSESTALEAIPTVTLTVPLMIRLVIGGVLQVWILQSGSNPNGPGVQRGLDFDAGTPKVWIQIS